MDPTSSSCGYCWKEEEEWHSLLKYKCDGCGKHFHYDCIKSSQPSPLLGDTFYFFKCQSCGEENKEDFQRRNISWKDVVKLTLYNLHKTGQGRCGYFHWRVHICAFIDLNWHVFFGPQRRKKGLWFGTVAGVLSSGCPSVFQSGVAEVEQGYWKMISVMPPSPQFDKVPRAAQRKRQTNLSPNVNIEPERSCRKLKANSLVAAIELKEKRSNMIDTGRRKKKKGDVKDALPSEATSQGAKEKERSTVPLVGAISNSSSQDANQSDVRQHSKPSDALSCVEDDQGSLGDSSSDISLKFPTLSSVKMEVESPVKYLSPSPSNQGSMINIFKTEASDEDDESDLDIDIESMATGPFSEMNDMQPPSPDVNTLLDIGCTEVAGKSPVKIGAKHVKLETFDDENLDDNHDKPLAREGDESLESSDESEMDEDEDGDDEEEDEEGDDVEDEGEDDDLQDDNADSLSGRENDMTCNRADASPSHKKKKKIGRPRKRRRLSDLPPASPPESLKRISLFEEGELLNKLNSLADKQPLTPELAQLRRKLLCNQTNREYGLPVFDLDVQVERVAKQLSLNQANHAAGRSDMKTEDMFLPKLASQASLKKETRDLDRFMMKDYSKKLESRTYSRFRQRLVGLEDKDLKPVISPYTTRVLMPFIWRNYHSERKPLKMRLLEEITSYPHRDDPTWKPEPTPPIDYCYIRPEHIPSVNALCREFFWPGIDMSECLQYPDFSCIVLYRKIVIGFAFMVPDRGYNEAYISFIFTHPEWRNAGIASVMLYHLIQTCMGKDVLLHVSASSPAMLLYQKFGFKSQELILNFYYKYFSLNSPECPHAFLMRLNR